ncbi:MAG: aspartate aminotransferase family protein [Rhodospirillales bacterium]|jgi:glutamate-1-semialdehyde 2,1-aminomutase
MSDIRRTHEERQILGRAATVLPGGTLGNVRLPDDYAFIVREGRGSRIWDISGNEYIDYLLGSGPMVVGHAHTKVLAAAEEAMRKGSTFFTQNPYAIELAERIVEAVPCADQVRYTSTGTEATSYALRVARAFTRRDKILKFEGGFHGMHDYSLMSLSPTGTLPFPAPEPSSAGIPKAIQDTVLVAPFNDIETTADIIQKNHNDLAAVIVEPVQRILAPQPGFLEGLREVTTRYDIPLIFDEVVTGFRMAYGGAQQYYGVTPDLTAIGKIVGGGFPLAAVVGRKELMDVYDAAAVGPGDFLPQVGTLNGNPVAAAAGLATLEIMRAPGLYEAYWEKGGRLRSGLQQMLDEAEIPATVSGIDLMFDIYFTETPITGFRSTMRADKSKNKIFDETLMEHGVFKPPGKVYVGVCHSEEDVQKTLAAFQAGVNALRD